METTKKEIKIETTIGQILYRTTYNFLQILETVGKVEIKDFNEQNPKGNPIKGFYQLKSFNDSKSFLKIGRVAETMAIELLKDETAKKVFAKLLRIGKNKFEAKIVI